jgi:DNA polymerase-3 subunit beta
MKVLLNCNDILPAVQAVTNVIERKQQVHPILAHILLTADGERLCVSGTDLEVELQTSCRANTEVSGIVTAPARKLLDILKSLPADATLKATATAGRLRIQSGRSHFTLSTLPAEEFPTLASEAIDKQLSIPVKQLATQIEIISHSMGINDVRFYLNGALLEVSQGELRLTAANGHQLATCKSAQTTFEPSIELRALLPRKAVLMLRKLLSGTKSERIEFELCGGFARFLIDDHSFTTKLIDGRYPDYERVIPMNNDQVALIDREALKQTLTRVAILTNEKFRGIRLSFSKDLLTIEATNAEQELAEEALEIEYQGNEISIGLNVEYLLDALSVIHGAQARIALLDYNAAVLVTPAFIEADESASGDIPRFVVMPMRL